LAGLEQKLAELYGFWAEAFEGDREAAFVFFKMSSEEKGHAALVDYARRFVQKDPKLGGDVDIDLALVQGTINKVRAVRETGVAPSVERAVEIALDLEASAATHARGLLDTGRLRCSSGTVVGERKPMPPRPENHALRQTSISFDCFIERRTS
jgi:hypothetical protein